MKGNGEGQFDNSVRTSLSLSLSLSHFPFPLHEVEKTSRQQFFEFIEQRSSRNKSTSATWGIGRESGKAPTPTGFNLSNRGGKLHSVQSVRL